MLHRRFLGALTVAASIASGLGVAPGAAGAAAAAPAASTHAKAPSYSRIVVFGDGLSDAGHFGRIGGLCDAKGCGEQGWPQQAVQGGFLHGSLLYGYEVVRWLNQTPNQRSRWPLRITIECCYAID